MNIEDDAKEKLKEQIDGKGIYVSHTWRFLSFKDLFNQLFGKKDKPDPKEGQDNG